MKKIKRTLAALLAAVCLVQAVPGELLQAYAEEQAESGVAAAVQEEAGQETAGSVSQNTSEITTDENAADSTVPGSSAEASTGEEEEDKESGSAAASNSAETINSEPADSAAESEAAASSMLENEGEEEQTASEQQAAEETAQDAAVQAELQIADVVDAYDSTNKVITISGGGSKGEADEQLRKLSNCNQQELQNCTINIEASASNFDLCNEPKGKDYPFNGFGSKEYPFEGTIKANISNITIDTTLFNGLSSKAKFEGDISNLQITWAGNEKKTIIAEVYQFDSQETSGHTLPVKTMTTGKINETPGTLGSLLGTVTAADEYSGETLNIGNIINYGTGTSAANVGVDIETGDAGLICGTLKKGCISLNDSYILPTTGFEVNTSDGDAGLLIGKMETGTTLQINTPLNTTAAITISASKNAGGLVGCMEDGAAIKTSENGTVNLASLMVTGGTSAGGVVGMAENAFVKQDDLQAAITVTNPTITGSNAGANVGGFIGAYTLGKDEEGQTVVYSLSDKIVIQAPKVLITGEQKNDGNNAGGYFGFLQLKGRVQYTIDGTTNNNLKTFEPCYRDNAAAGGNAWSYGGLIGKVAAEKIEGTLYIKNVKVTSTFSTYKVSQNRPKYHGGLIGDISSGTYVNVQGVEIAVANPHAIFGGAAGCLAEKSILIVNGITVGTEDGRQDAKIWEGGGVLGNAKEGSVLELSGKTDLSGVHYERNDNKTGQLVGENESALIYAKGDGNGNGNGWTYIRSNFAATSNGTTYNDLLCYGQVIRLNQESDSNETGLSSDLVQVNETTHEVKLKNPSSAWSGNINLNTADDFALLSIAWNSRGYFSADSNSITIENWSSLKSKTINLSANIDLTGTGITGLSRDINTATADDTFTGRLDGNSYILTLAIGETYGFQGTESRKPDQDTDGCGIVYATNSYHAAQGIFAKIQGAAIKNITINGNISVSNGYHAIAAGGVAACTEGENTIDKVTASEKLFARDAANSEMQLGGLFGKESGGQLTLKGKTTANPKIEIKTGTNQNGSYVSAGCVLGKAVSASFKLVADGAEIGGFITTDTTGYAYVGGLIGLIAENKEHWVEIRDLTISVLTINTNSATQVSGGLLGSVWQSVGVYFMGENANETKSMLTVENCTINAKAVNGVGGLCYRSSGIWEIRDYGINMESLTITSGRDVGLLVCHGENNSIRVNYSSGAAISDPYKNIGALYLLTTAHWSTAYKLAEENTAISISQSEGGVFDEFVAHTVITPQEITGNGGKKITDSDDETDETVELGETGNGVISIATQSNDNSRIGVEENDTICTTYKNRTAYGTEYKTNGCSRYYYDLDQWLKEASKDTTHNNNKTIDTPQELLLWSVYRYAYSNIKSYFYDYAIDGTKYTAPDITNKDIITITGDLDMQKYSYYPIDIAENITIQNAKIKFYNGDIEKAEETANKSTQGTNKAHTQHYTMHCGLFLNQTAGDTTVSLNTVTFAGSIGRVNSDGSGALFAGNVQGSSENGAMKTAAISMNGIILAGLKVTDCESLDYAPMLVNTMGSYTSLTADDIKDDSDGYTPVTAAATSLIGRVGSADAKQISLNFTKIVLPDKSVDSGEGIFKNATLLQSFTHDGTSSVGTYNFNKDEEWTDTNYKHSVTYGYEITESTEYKDQQLWYYDEAGYGTDPNRVHTDATNPTNFSSVGYLRYVAVEYNPDNHTHELKVNQRMDNIVSGCGTYGHPYRIVSSREMKILAEYMATGNAPQGWCVTVTGDQSTNHEGTADKTDVTYKYKKDGDAEWVEVNKSADTSSDKWDEKEGGRSLTNDEMHAYLLNAYYDLQGTGKTLALTNFAGFGNEIYPFRGVLTSTTGTTVVLEGIAPGNGLIGYSYGSVVKDLTISYEQCSSKELNKNSTSTGTDAVVRYYSDTVFGGVIGCVLGGDNIIDGVSVQYKNKWLTVSGDKKHLIPVGGYVGEICGGGVILRNLKTTDTGLANIQITGATSVDTNESLANMYINPYVGRVLDGFAIYEVTKTSTDAAGLAEELNNTSKNYEITTLDDKDAGCVKVADGIVTAVNNKGLFVLSAVVNSGAASGGISNAYSIYSNSANNTNNYQFGSNYGKVRNAAYSGIGGTKETADFALSVKDDQKTPATDNLPYLVEKYCTGVGEVFALAKGSAKIALMNNGEYDMTKFGTGYQGIGARYVSSAVLQKNAINAKGVEPEIAEFNGNSSTIIVNTQVKEYKDDDFHAAAVGGVMNLLRVGNSGSVIKKLTITRPKSAETNTEVSLKYYDKEGKESTWGESIADVGGFAGSICMLSNPDTNTAIGAFESVKVEGLNIFGSRYAGGLLGSSLAKEGTESLNGTEYLIYNADNHTKSNVGIQLKQVAYKNLKVKATEAAGGFVGANSVGSKSTVSSGLNDDSTAEAIIGENSDIESGRTENNSQQETKTGSGGVFGYVKASEVYISATKVELQNVCISADQYAGGVIGLIDDSSYNIQNVEFKEATIKTNVTQTATISSQTPIYEGAGGIVGYAKGKGTIYGCSVKLTQINKEENVKTPTNAKPAGAGGIVGVTCKDETKIKSCEVNDSKIYGAIAGGIDGTAMSKTTITNCKVGTESSELIVSGYCTASGILGYWYSGSSGTLEKCYVKNSNISGKHWGVGALVGDDHGAGGALYIYDTSVQNSTVSANGGSWYQVGGIIGDLRSDLTASNLLFDGVEIKMPGTNGENDHYKGLLIAYDIGKNSGKTIKIAGISIQNIPDESQDLQLIGNEKAYNGYIAFADYSGTALKAEAEQQTNMLDATAAEPYVTTSPKSQLSVEDENSEKKWLYGDAVYSQPTTGTDGKTTTVSGAQIILNGINAGNKEHYAYTKAAQDFELSLISSYNANQTTQANADFPVLLLTNSGDATAIVTNYLDILTNGGFTQAKSVAGAVSTATSVYEYRDGKFVKSAETTGAFTASGSNNYISFRVTTDWDNDKNRFTLLTVTFTAGKGTYKVQVPVMVRRRMEVDFSATLSYGTNFRKADYESLAKNGVTHHVLESFGSTISGYLTYTYNSKEGAYTAYGWDNYINAGGNVAGTMQKKLQFAFGANTDVPAGTQLTLVDEKTKKAYYYTLEETKQDTKELVVSFTEFKDSDGKAYQEPSIADLMQAKAEKTEDGTGTFVKVDAADSPTVKSGDDYYRLAKESDTGDRYKITVSETDLKQTANNKETSAVAESFYLVITVPKQSGTQKAMNGSLKTTLTDGIPHFISYRTIDNYQDVQVNTASTYMLSSGYQQALLESKNTVRKKMLSTSDTVLTVNVTDTVTFPAADQIYNAADQLYLRIVGSLQKTVSNTTTVEQFPSGTTGLAKFYVYTRSDETETYYTYQKGEDGTYSWSPADNNADGSLPEAASYTWVSDGKNMELPLSADGTAEKLISLQSMRDKVKADGGDTFYVQVKMEASIPAAGLEVIPESKLENDTPKDYAKLSYSAQLSTVSSGLAYSSNRAVAPTTETMYYRDEPLGVKLTYTADKADQLGIDLSDLQAGYLQGNDSLIDTTAVYDLSALKGLSETLKNSSGIRFTLTLSQKNAESETEGYGNTLADAKEYIQVELKSKDSGEAKEIIDENTGKSTGVWSWTVPKATYCDENGIHITDGVFDGNELKQRIRLKVNTANVESAEHYFSNYKVTLTAEILGADGQPMADVDKKDDYLVYTLTKIKTEFVEAPK